MLAGRHHEQILKCAGKRKYGDSAKVSYELPESPNCTENIIIHRESQVMKKSNTESFQ